jgi:hypothetical protein
MTHQINIFRSWSVSASRRDLRDMVSDVLDAHAPGDLVHIDIVLAPRGKARAGERRHQADCVVAVRGNYM